MTYATAGGLHPTHLQVDLRGRTLLAPDLPLPLPRSSAAWRAAATAHQFVVVSLTYRPLAAPTMAHIDALFHRLTPGMAWLGQACQRSLKTDPLRVSES